jgi:hypothetical protein
LTEICTKYKEFESILIGKYCDITQSINGTKGYVAKYPIPHSNPPFGNEKIWIETHVPFYDIPKWFCPPNSGDSYDKHKILDRKQIETAAIGMWDEIEQFVDVQF